MIFQRSPPGSERNWANACDFPQVRRCNGETRWVIDPLSSAKGERGQARRVCSPLDSLDLKGERWRRELRQEWNTNERQRFPYPLGSMPRPIITKVDKIK